MSLLVYADPPWPQRRGGKKAVRPNSSGIELPYKVTTIEHIEELMRPHCENADVLFLWAIEKYLHEAEQLGENLGFRLHARMIWNKVTGIPAAFTIRYGHDYLLFMYKSPLLPISIKERGKIHSVFTERVTKHSKKPVVAYQIIERLYPDCEKLELFARSKRSGWSVWGDEAPTEEES